MKSLLKSLSTSTLISVYGMSYEVFNPRCHLKEQQISVLDREFVDFLFLSMSILKFKGLGSMGNGSPLRDQEGMNREFYRRFIMLCPFYLFF